MAQAYFKAYIGNAVPVGRQSQFTLIQEVNKHEVAQLTLQDAAYSKTMYRTGMPIRVDYGYTPSALDTFYGYINDAKQTISSNKRNVTLTCVGASMVLNQKQVKVWGNVTGSYIARTVAIQNKMTPYVQSHPYVFHNYVQSGSTFGALTWLAEKLGYTTYINGTGLFFYDPTSPVITKGNQIPAFNFPLQRGLFGSLISFHPSIGENTGASAQAQRMQRQATGIDLFQKSLIGAKSAVELDVAFNSNYAQKPVFNEFVNHSPFSTQGQVQQALLSADMVNRFWVTSTAQVWGDPRVHQGGYVDIRGVDDTHTGLWYVQKATHNITYTPTNFAGYTYKIDMNLGRDQVDQTTYAPSPLWQNAKAQPPTIFLNGGWRSSFAVDNSFVQSA